MKRIFILALIAFTAPAAMATQSEVVAINITEEAKPISTEDFEHVMQVLKGRSSEEMKIKAAMKGLKKGTMNIDQVSEVMDYLKSEESKLEFAKAAYDQCLEKEAFREIVDEKFKDAESVKALSEYISSK
jgi:hypothetical protein